VKVGVASYFSLFGLNISVTLIRKMLETAYFNALQEKTIDYDEYSIVSKCNWCMLIYINNSSCVGMHRARSFS
jgi:hypothetical protein